MIANKGVISALLGVALLAMPLTAAAQPLRYNGSRPMLTPVHDRDDWHSRHRSHDHGGDVWRRHHRNEGRWREGWRNQYYAPTYRDECRRPAPRANNFYNRDSYQPGDYWPESYNTNPQSYGATLPGGLERMIYQRDSAEYQYRMALRRGNRDRARHLANDIAQLNKDIANARMRRGTGPAYGNFNPPMGGKYASPNGYGSGYGYGNSQLDSFLGPLLGNYIP